MPVTHCSLPAPCAASPTGTGTSLLAFAEAPAWATQNEAFDGYAKHSTVASVAPLDGESRDAVPITMDVNDRLSLDTDGSVLILRDDAPWINIGAECAYRFTPAEARILAKALIELADDADHEVLAGS